MTDISKEEVEKKFLEYELKHNVTGCEAVREIKTFIHGDLQSDIFDLKTAAEAQLGLSSRLEILDNPKTGLTTILWEERTQMLNYFKSILEEGIKKVIFLIGGGIASAAVIGFGYFYSQASSLQKTDAKLELTNRYQLAQTLFVKYSSTGDISAKQEAENILKSLLTK